MQTNHPSPVSFQQVVTRYLLQIEGRPVRYGLGCAYLHRDEKDREAVKEAVRVLEAAYASGFRYFDTASAYGSSERILGEFVPSVPRASIFLASKSSIPAEASPAQLADYVRKSLDESLSRLRTDYLDLFQLHDFESTEAVLSPGGVIETLREARRQGLIRFFGPATRGHAVLEACARTGAFDTILTYRDFSIRNQSAARLIETVRALGLGVINASPVSGLEEHGYDLSDEAVLAAALQFPLANPHIDITLTGPANLAQLQANLRALSRPLDRSALKDTRSS